MADETVTKEGLHARIAELEEINAELDKQLTAEKAKTAAAKKRLKVERAAKSPEARKLGAMKPPRSEEEAAARQAAIAVAIGGGMTQVVFSDGRREIRELNPLNVGGDGWRETPHGHVLDDEPLLEPGDCERESMELRGFALLDADGNQIGYQALPDAIVIRRNQLIQLAKNTIRF